MSKSREKIIAEFTVEKDPPIIMLADKDYAAPTSIFLFSDEVLAAWKLYCDAHPYVKKHDCDDFAFEYKSFMQGLHAQSKFPEDGFAVGVVFYLVGNDPTKGHAICWALTEDRGLIYIEPQTGLELVMSATEVGSRFFVYG